MTYMKLVMACYTSCVSSLIGLDASYHIPSHRSDKNGLLFLDVVREAKRELFYVIVVVGYQDAFRITNSKKEAIMNLLLLLLEPTYFLFVCCSIVLYSIYTTIMMYWRLRSVT